MDENGNVSEVKKDPVDRVIQQMNGCHSEVSTTSTFDYDALGNKTAATNGRGFTTSYQYDDLNRLIQKILPEAEMLNDPDSQPAAKSAILKYEYDQEGNLVREISPLGTVINHVYDEMNREIKTRVEFRTASGLKTAETKTYYDLAGNKTKVVDPNGKTSEFTYSARGWLLTQKDPAGGITSFTYDPVGNKISETDPRGNAPGAPENSYTAWYFYDELYRVVKAVLPDNTPPANPENPGDNPVLAFEYDLNGNCIKETKANGQVINYTYDGRNRLLTQSQSLDGKNYKTTFQYDGVGNKIAVIDNKDNKTKYDYDSLNRLIVQTFPKGNTIVYNYDKNGNRTEVRDGMHNLTKSVYDPLNRVSQVIDANENTTYYWYNEEGGLTKTKSANGQVTKYYLNEIGLPLEVVDSLGHRRTFDYDVAGNVTSKTDPIGTKTTFQYDDLYRVLRMDLQNGSRSQSLSYEYDPVGNVKKASNGQVDSVYNDADGNYISDPFNRIQKVKQIMPDGTSYTTQYRYDIMGQMTGIRYPNSLEWLEYQYDQMGRLIGIPGFAGNKNSPGFTYDDNSALESVKTDNGVVTIYQRDKNGRITNINAGKSGIDILSLHYEYDNANNIIKRNDNSYIYDKLNRLQQATIRGYFEDNFTKADMLMGKVDNDYHGEREAEEDVTEQTRIEMDYSARSLIFNLKFEAENICRVELVPEISSHRVPTDQLEIYYRNGVGFTKLERNQWNAVKDEKGRIIIRFTPVLNTSEIKIHSNYDDLDYLQMPVDRSEFYNSPEKLVTVYQKIINRTETYTYDGLGNRLSEKILLRKEYEWSYEYYSNSNRLKAKKKDDGSEKFEYAYDANGNLISKIVTKGGMVDSWEYSYDLLNQLEQVKKNGEVVSSYVYDPNGFRVEKNGNKGRIDYVPLLNGEVGYRREFSNSKEYSFIYVGGQHLARVNGVIGGPGKKFYYHNDHLGSAPAVTDENGNKVVERDFAPFGERLQLEENDGIKPDEDDSGFTGKDWDEDVRLYYYNARWYDPGIGRFTSEDSVADGNNPYIYCANNPVNNIDPTGHWKVEINWTGGLLSTVISQIPGLGEVVSGLNAFKTVIKGLDQSKWAKFLRAYTSMGEEQFKEYLKNEGINYEFNENNTSDYTFMNTDGQQALDRKQFTNGEDRALTGDEKLAAFEAMKGNIKGFLENNPGLSLEQVKSLYDSAVMSADHSWGFGKNEFRFEGRGSNYNTVYGAEAVVMNEGMVEGVFTRASTKGDVGTKTIKGGIYNYWVNYHHLGRTDTQGNTVFTEIGQEPPKDANGNYINYVDPDGNTGVINSWTRGTYKALRLEHGGFIQTLIANIFATNINSHAGNRNSTTGTGSAGCMTMHADDYQSYMDLFNMGERGKFIVIR